MTPDPRKQRRQMFQQLQAPPDGGAMAESMAPPPPPEIQPMGAQRAQPRGVPGQGIQPVGAGGPRQQQYGITPGAIANAPPQRPVAGPAVPGQASAFGPGQSRTGGLGQGGSVSAPGTPPGGGAFNYEQARDSWMSGQYGSGREGAAAWAAANGVPYDGSDTITLPNGGGMIDIIGNFGGGAGNGQAMRNNWTPAGGNGLGGANGSGGGPGGGAQGGVGPGGAGGPGGGPGGDFNSQVRSMLMQQLGDMGKTPGADDPIIANQVNAYRNEKVRAGDRQRAALAERAAASGLLSGGQSSGAFDTGIQGIQEGIGEDVGQFSAGAVSKELYNRRDKMTQLMNMALASGDAQSARELQMQIAQMDNELRRSTLGENRRQFDQGFGEDRRRFDDQFGRQLGRDAEDDQRFRLEFGF